MVRIATGLWLVLALPGLVFGFISRVAPLPRLCEPSGAQMEVPYATSGVPCQLIDPSLLYWLVPALVLLMIAAGVGASRHADALR
jgi:hypothetical protein